MSWINYGHWNQQAQAALGGATVAPTPPPPQVNGPPPQFASPWTSQQMLKFTGTLNDPGERHQQLSFWVLAGVNAPTPTDGWTQIANIARPRRKGFTMPTGYNPCAMDVDIRFEGTVPQYGWSPAQIERNIQILEWMAGRGKLYANGTHPAQGDPPIVQVSSFDQSGNATNLIPPNFHSDAPDDLRWLISGLKYDPSPVRGPEGDRHRQDITVSLVEYVAVPGAPKSPRQRQKGRGSQAGEYKTVVTTAAVNTIAKVCHHLGIFKQSSINQVVRFNQSRLRVTSAQKPLKVGTQVQVPTSIKPDRTLSHSGISGGHG